MAQGGELWGNLTEAGVALSAELAEYEGTFTLMDKSLSFAPFTGSGGMVYGTLRALPEDKSLSDENIRFSAMLEQTENGTKLVHIHFSHADMAQEQGDYFVKQAARSDNQSLRAELNMRERQLANLTKNIPGGAHQCASDSNLTLLSMSDGFLSMFGYTKEEIEVEFDGKFINMVYPGDRADMIKRTYAQLENGSDLELEYRVLRKFGQPIWVLDKGRLMEDGNGGTCFYCLLIDITQRKCQQEELRLSLERHKVIVDQASDIIFEWDIPAFVKIMKDTASGVPYSETEFRIRNLSGKYYWCRIRATAQYNADGRPIKAVGVIVDIDEEKKQKQVLMQQAQYDTLTGIFNKATINALVEQRMHDNISSGKGTFGIGRPNYHALLMIDVDYFKAVNDNYGHLCGDSVLSDVAAALKGSVRSGDLVEQYLAVGEKDQEYYEIQKKLDQLLLTMKAKYIYVAGVDTSDYMTMTYVFDAYNPESPFPPYELGYVSKDVNELYVNNMKTVMTTGERVNEYCYSYFKKFGAHTTAGVAVSNSQGKIVAFLGVEKAMSALDEARRTYVLSVVLATGAAMVFFIAAYLFYLYRSIINPLLLITKEAESFLENESQVSDRLLNVRNKDEIGVLAKAVNKLETDINEYIGNLTAVTAEKERIGAELNVATQIQVDMLPRIFPAFPQHKEFDIFATMTPAKEVGGDFYDFYMIEERYLCVVIADVSGKGVPAALLTREGEISWIDKAKGFVLAGMEGMKYQARELSFQTGDRLFLYTDGVTEATDAEERMFGEEKLKNIILETRNHDLESVLGCVKSEIDKFAGEAEQFDDITMVMMEFKQAGEYPA